MTNKYKNKDELLCFEKVEYCWLIRKPVKTYLLFIPGKYFSEWTLWKLRFWNCEFVNYDISELWISWKLRFWYCELCENWDFEIVNFIKIENLKLKNVNFVKIEILNILTIFSITWDFYEVTRFRNLKSGTRIDWTIISWSKGFFLFLSIQRWYSNTIGFLKFFLPIQALIKTVSPTFWIPLAGWTWPKTWNFGLILWVTSSNKDLHPSLFPQSPISRTP